MGLISRLQTTPYAAVTFFRPVSSFSTHNINSFKQLVTVLNQHLNNRNVPYAIHIKGYFSDLKLRAVRGAQPPYPSFPELVKKQAIFNLKDVEGDAVGIFFPVYLSKLNVPGYHIHFITKDRQTGGHILETKISQATIELMPLDQITVKFPQTPEFEQSKKLNKDNLKLMLNSFGDGVQPD